MKYSVTFQRCQFQTVEVEAESYSAAEDIAYDTLDEESWRDSEYSDADVIDVECICHPAFNDIYVGETIFLHGIKALVTYKCDNFIRVIYENDSVPTTISEDVYDSAVEIEESNL